MEKRAKVRSDFILGGTITLFEKLLTCLIFDQIQVTSSRVEPPNSNVVQNLEKVLHFCSATAALASLIL